MKHHSGDVAVAAREWAERATSDPDAGLAELFTFVLKARRSAHRTPDAAARPPARERGRPSLPAAPPLTRTPQCSGVAIAVTGERVASHDIDELVASLAAEAESTCEARMPRALCLPSPSRPARRCISPRAATCACFSRGIPQGGDEPLWGKPTREATKFRSAFASLWDRLVRDASSSAPLAEGGADENEAGGGGGASSSLLGRALSFLVALSGSNIRQLRVGATLCGLALGTGLVKVAVRAGAERDLATRQAGAHHPGRAAAAQHAAQQQQLQLQAAASHVEVQKAEARVCPASERLPARRRSVFVLLVLTRFTRESTPSRCSASCTSSCSPPGSATPRPACAPSAWPRWAAGRPCCPPST